MFSSATEAIIRYVQLYQLLSCPRSIPLGIKKTHVSRTDSHDRWENIRVEFASIATAFPSSGTDPWYLLTVSVMTNKMPHERRKYLEQLTNKTWSPYLFERETNRAYGNLTRELRARDMLTEVEGYN